MHPYADIGIKKWGISSLSFKDVPPQSAQTPPHPTYALTDPWPTSLLFPAGATPAPATGRAFGRSNYRARCGCNRTTGSRPPAKPGSQPSATPFWNNPTQWSLPPEVTARIQGALLVAPADPERLSVLADFAPVPFQTLPYRNIVVASSNDPYCPVRTAGAYARAWGSEFVRLQTAGHINVDSGFGAWPLRLALLQSL